MRLALLFLIATTHVFACSCLPPPPVSEALKKSDYVIHGRCLSFAITDRQTRLGRFEIIRVFKGKEIREICDIETGLNGASCGFDFIAGHDYLIFGSISDGIYRTNICTRTKSIYLTKAMVDVEYEALLKMVGLPEKRWKEFDPPLDDKDPFK